MAHVARLAVTYEQRKHIRRSWLGVTGMHQAAWHQGRRMTAGRIGGIVTLFVMLVYSLPLLCRTIVVAIYSSFVISFCMLLNDVNRASNRQRSVAQRRRSGINVNISVQHSAPKANNR